LPMLLSITGGNREHDLLSLWSCFGELVSGTDHAFRSRATRHWINPVVMLVMITSGWGIYDDDVIIRELHISGFWRLGDWAAWSLNWHFAGMCFLAINGLAYLICGFASGRYRNKLLPIRPAELVRTVVETLQFKIAHKGIAKLAAAGA
jgi:thiosulfate reductase cytochrome b subunit